jgi:hypothetical protein
MITLGSSALTENCASSADGHLDRLIPVSPLSPQYLALQHLHLRPWPVGHRVDVLAVPRDLCWSPGRSSEHRVFTCLAFVKTEMTTGTRRGPGLIISLEICGEFSKDSDAEHLIPASLRCCLFSLIPGCDSASRESSERMKSSTNSYPQPGGPRGWPTLRRRLLV